MRDAAIHIHRLCIQFYIVSKPLFNIFLFLSRKKIRFHAHTQQLINMYMGRCEIGFRHQTEQKCRVSRIYIGSRRRNVLLKYFNQLEFALQIIENKQK